MNLFGVISDEVIHQQAVEIIRFIDIVAVIIGKLFLDGTVESLQVAIGLGGDPVKPGEEIPG
jgi:Na+-transporting NADH:ubiquinone oxidoreductase subunit NqrA